MRHEIPTDIFLEETIYHIKQEIEGYNDERHALLESRRISIANKLFADFKKQKDTIIFDNNTHEDDERVIAEKLNRIRSQTSDETETDNIVAVLRAIQITRADLNHNPDYIQVSEFIKILSNATKFNIKELSNNEIQIDVPLEIRANAKSQQKEIFYEEDMEDALNYKYSLRGYDTIHDIFTVDKPRNFERKRIYSVTLSKKYEHLFNDKEQLDELYMDLINPLLTIITYSNIRKEQLRSKPWLYRALDFIKNKKF